MSARTEPSHERERVARRRAGVRWTFGATIAAGLLLWARLIVISELPQMAIAEKQTAIAERPTAIAERPSAQQTDVVPTRPNALAAPDAPAAPDDLGATEAGPCPERPARIVRTLRPVRDPFVLSPSHFPKPTRPASLVVEAEKSDRERAEDPAGRESPERP